MRHRIAFRASPAYHPPAEYDPADIAEKGWVREHTRRARDGAVVTVEGHHDKRTKKTRAVTTAAKRTIKQTPEQIEAKRQKLLKEFKAMSDELSALKSGGGHRLAKGHDRESAIRILTAQRTAVWQDIIQAQRDAEAAKARTAAVDETAKLREHRAKMRETARGYAEHAEAKRAEERTPERKAETREEIRRREWEKKDKSPHEMTLDQYHEHLFTGYGELSEQAMRRSVEETKKAAHATKHRASAGALMRGAENVQRNIESRGRTNPYIASKHKAAVRDALRTGKRVPDEVLKDYPDLAPKKEPAAPPPDGRRISEAIASTAQLDAPATHREALRTAFADGETTKTIDGVTYELTGTPKRWHRATAKEPAAEVDVEPLSKIRERHAQEVQDADNQFSSAVAGLQERKRKSRTKQSKDDIDAEYRQMKSDHSDRRSKLHAKHYEEIKDHPEILEQRRQTAEMLRLKQLRESGAAPAEQSPAPGNAISYVSAVGPAIQSGNAKAAEKAMDAARATQAAVHPVNQQPLASDAELRRQLAEMQAKIADLEKMNDAQRAAAEAKDRQIAEMQAKPKRQRTANETVAMSPDLERSYQFRHRIVDLDAMIPSNKPAGSVNPKYLAELQPRDRTRAMSRAQVVKMASKLDSDSLLSDFRQIDRGAVIIGSDMMVESGNGRTLALLEARQSYPAKFAEYQSLLRERLDEFGLSEADLAGIKTPVLVRERITGGDDMEFRKAFCHDANAPTGLTMSRMEVAKNDAQILTPEFLAMLRVDEDEELTSALRRRENNAFCDAFIGGLSMNEQASLRDSRGRLSRAAIDRVKAALYVKVFPGAAGEKLAETFLESTDSSVRNFENAVGKQIGLMARAQSLIDAGQRSRDLDISGDLAAAVAQWSVLKDEGKGAVDQYIRQLDMFAGAKGLSARPTDAFQDKILSWLEGNAGKPKVMREMLGRYAQAVIDSGGGGTGSLGMGGFAAKNRDEVWAFASGTQPEPRQQGFSAFTQTLEKNEQKRRGSLGVGGGLSGML